MILNVIKPEMIKLFMEDKNVEKMENGIKLNVNIISVK